MNRRIRSGFTLVELLVVIAIITILVTMVVTLVINVQRNAQIARTTASLKAIVTALNSYNADFRTLPPVYWNNVTWSTGNTPAGNTPELRNAALLSYLTQRFDLGTKRFGPYLPHESQQDLRYQDFGINNPQRDPADNLWAVALDAWQLPLHFIMPGCNHSADVDADGAPKPGMDNSVLSIGGGGFPASLDTENMRYDLYSFGPDNKDNYGTFTAGTFAKNGVNAFHAHSTTFDHNDDITSWAEASKKQ